VLISDRPCYRIKNELQAGIDIFQGGRAEMIETPAQEFDLDDPNVKRLVELLADIVMRIMADGPEKAEGPEDTQADERE